MYKLAIFFTVFMFLCCTKEHVKIVKNDVPPARSQAKHSKTSSSNNIRVTVSGPDKIYRLRAVDYTITIDNPGQAITTTVELIATFSRNNWQFISCSDQGIYTELSSSTATITWRLPTIPGKDKKELQLQLQALQAGGNIGVMIRPVRN